MGEIIKLKKKHKKHKKDKKKKNKKMNMVNSNQINININTDAKPRTDKSKNDASAVNDKIRKTKLTNSIFGTTQNQSRIVTTYPSEVRELVEDIIRANPSRFNQMPLENMRRPIDNNTTFGYDERDGIDVPSQFNSFNRTIDQSLFQDSADSLNSLETQIPLEPGFITEENAPYMNFKEHQSFVKESQQAALNKKQEKSRIAKEKALEKQERYRLSQEKQNK